MNGRLRNWKIGEDGYWGCWGNWGSRRGGLQLLLQRRRPTSHFNFKISSSFNKNQPTTSLLFCIIFHSSFCLQIEPSIIFSSSPPVQTPTAPFLQRSSSLPEIAAVATSNHTNLRLHLLADDELQQQRLSATFYPSVELRVRRQQLASPGVLLLRPAVTPCLLPLLAIFKLMAALTSGTVSRGCDEQLLGGNGVRLPLLPTVTAAAAAWSSPG